jgi:hypothetical protein
MVFQSWLGIVESWNAESGCKQATGHISQHICLTTGAVQCEPVDTLSKVRFGKKLGDNIIPWPPLEDKLLSNKWWILGHLNVLNATALSRKFSTASFLRYGLLTGNAPTPGDKLSNKWLILANLTLRNASPPSKMFSTVPFLRYSFWLGAPPTLGDKLLSNKWLILANLTLGNAPPPSNNFSCAVFEIQLLTWNASYAGG